MFKIKVNNEYFFNLDKKGKDVHLNDEKLKLDISSISDRESHVIYKDRSFNVSIVELNKETKKCSLKVNGNRYEVEAEDHFDQLLKQLGMDSLATNKIAEIKAPMPGLVLSILVEEGNEINKGDGILVLEAMKMENILKSSTGGTIKKILVKQGDKVEKNQVLVQFK